ncbi:MAG: tyrosine-protein phosphatase [Bacteroidetes bacterium]|nr:MAG: tyrosine-protein phosphatase [Bacteroidota bacterium]
MKNGPNGSPFLESQPNFRSLEGIKTISGRKFRKNMVYRSGSLYKLSPSDVIRLEGIGLSLVIDFRSDREIVSYPSVAVPSVKKTMRITIPDEARDLAMEFLERNDAEGLKTILVTDYRRMIRNDTGRFTEFFRTLEKTTDFPLVYHCAAGKDRTGLASVLLLTALGADPETIRADYFLSNIRLKSFAEKVIKKFTEEGKNGEIIRPMMEVRQEYLEAALDEINQSFGGMENYLHNVLKVNAELLSGKYLE